MKKIKEKLNNFFKSLTVFKVLAIFIIVYFGILIYKQIKPQSYQEKFMHCMDLGSNLRAEGCVNSLHKEYGINN
jgi:hypothetical protein